MVHGIKGDVTGDDRRSTDTEGIEDLLSDPHCRYLLTFLDDADGEVTVSTAARHVVAGITGSDPDSVSPDVQRRVQTWLHHGQLPRLAERGIVEFDPDANTVSLTDSDVV